MQAGLSTVCARVPLRSGAAAGAGVGRGEGARSRTDGARPGSEGTGLGLVAPEDLALRIERAGVDFSYLDGGMPADYYAVYSRLALRRGLPPPRVVECVFPHARAANAMLASSDREEASTALAAARATLDIAAEAGARYVVLRLGEVGALKEAWAAARRAFLRGEVHLPGEGPGRGRDSGARSVALDRLLAARAAEAGRAVDLCLRALDPLAAHADRLGLGLAIRNPARAIGLPSPVELRVLRAELRGAPIHAAFDFAAAHLATRMGLVDEADLHRTWSGAPVALVSDACGAVSGLPPGRGEIDFGPAFEVPA